MSAYRIALECERWRLFRLACTEHVRLATRVLGVDQ